MIHFDSCTSIMIAIGAMAKAEGIKMVALGVVLVVLRVMVVA